MNLSLNRNAEFLRQSQSLIALFVLCASIALLSENFLTASNLWNVLRQISVNVCIAVGMTLVVLMAGIDLSVGSVLALSGAVCAGLVRNGIGVESLDLFIGFTTLGGVLAAMLVGWLLGVFNGWIITRFVVPPFVATLGMLTIARGLTMLYTQGIPISNLGAGLEFIGSGWFLGIPVPVWISLIVVLLFIFISQNTTLGRHIYAIGGNEKAAVLSGIRVKRVKILVYGFAGMLAGMGGILVTARLNSAQPNAGMSYELDAIAAVVIGGTSLSGGVGSVKGTVIGAAIIGVLGNGLVLLNVSPFWQQVVKGLVILLAVIIDRMNRKNA